MPNEKGVSILVPVYNARRWLTGCIANLTDVLKVAPDDVEILFVDNGSDDGTAEVVQSFQRRDARIKAFSAPEKGIVSALNIGLAHARYPWIMRHDADDFSHPQRINYFRNALLKVSFEQREIIAMVASHSVLSQMDGHVISVLSAPEGTNEILPRLQPLNSLVHGSVFLRKSAVEERGGYREILPHAEDLDLWRRLGEANWKLLGIPHYLYWFRIHATSVSAANLKIQMSSVEKFSPPEKNGLWSPLDRAAIRQLIWCGQRKEAFHWASKSFHFGLPTQSDFFHLVRLIFGKYADVVNGWVLRRRESEISEFYDLVMKYSRASDSRGT